MTMQASSSPEGTGRVVAVCSPFHVAEGQPAPTVIATQPLQLFGGYSY